MLFWAGYMSILLLASLPKQIVLARWGQFVWGLTSAIALVALTRIWSHWDGRRLRDVGLVIERATAVRFLAGAVFGFVVFGCTIGTVALITGSVRLVPADVPGVRSVILMLTTLLALSAMEELGFRGYALRSLARSLGSWRAQAIVAVAFALSHVAFGWPWQTIVLGVLPSALLFGACAVASNGLAMPIGVHWAVNVGRWAVGESDGTGLWTIVVDEAAQLSVAGIAPAVGLVLTLLATIIVWMWGKRSAPGVPPESASADQVAT